MEALDRQTEGEHPEDRPDRRPLLLIILITLFLFLIALTCLFIGSAARATRQVSAPIEYPVHSTFVADYQPVPYGTRIASVDMSIIKEALSDLYFYEDKMAVEEVFDAVSEALKTPVSTATPYNVTAAASTSQAGTAVAQVSATPPMPTAGPATQTALAASSTPSAAFTATLVPTNTPTTVYIPPTKTPVPPTSTFTSTPTNTPSAPTVVLLLTASTTAIDEPGGSITYEVQVRNTFSSPVAVTSLVDSQAGDLNGSGTCNSPANPYPAALAPSAVYTCYFLVSLTGDPGDMYANTVSVQVLDTLSRTGSDSASAAVSITDVPPSLTVSKTAGVGSVVEPGGMVSFTVTVTNTSVEPVTLTHLIDDKAGSLNGSGTCLTGGVIAVSGSYSCVFSFMASGSGGEVFTNTVTAQVQDDEGNNAAMAGSASVNILAVTPVTISGSVRLDADGDGDLGDSDAGISGVNVQLFDGTCTLGLNCPLQTTAADGSFAFTGVTPGSYTLIETDPAGHYSTADSAGGNDNQIALTVINAVDNAGHVFLDAACGAPPDAVNGYVSGISPADGAIVSYLGTSQVVVTYTQAMILAGPGSVLNLANYGGGLVNTTFGGTVAFSGVSYNHGTRTVTLTLDTSDPDWLPGSTYTLQIAGAISNACAIPQSVTVVRTFRTMSAISGQVREDADLDGDLNDLDAGIAGVTIELEEIGVCTRGVDCLTTTTDANGYYFFYDLEIASYAIHEIDPTGYYSTNDYNGFNFNRIPYNMTSASIYVTGRDFLDAIACTAPHPLTGFVASTNPADGAAGVSPLVLTVTFNQPMQTAIFGGSVTNYQRYSLVNLDSGGVVDILLVLYDSGAYTVTVYFDTSDPDWIPGDHYAFTIENGIRNACNVNQGVDVTITFQTEP